MLREKAEAAPTARPKVPMRRLGAHCLVVVMKRGNARGAKGVGHQRWIGSTGNGRNPIINGRRQPSLGGTSRMMREYHVRICEGLGVKFPESTRHKQPPAMQKRLGQGQTYTPDRDRLSIQPWETADAAERVHRGAWKRGGVAGGGAGTTARTDAAYRRPHGGRRKRSRAEASPLCFHASAYGLGLDRGPQRADRPSVGPR